MINGSEMAVRDAMVELQRRFHQLFPPTYLYLGHMYLFGREVTVYRPPPFYQARDL